MSTLKDNTQESGRVTKDNVILRCAECMHFEGSPHPSIGQACSLIGVKRYATAPNCYTPNVHVFRKTSPQTLNVLASVVSSFSPQQSLVLMGLLREQASMKRKFNISFLEKVFFLIGEDFLENYFAGFALGSDPDGNILIVGSQYFKDQKNSIVASLSRKSVLNWEEFRKVRDMLSARGKLYMPRRKIEVELPPNLDDYEPPTLETTEELLEKQANKSTKRRVKKAEVLEIRYDA